MAKPVIPASSILDALPSELSRGLFAQGRLLSLDADQTLFLAGDEGDGCYRVEEGLLKASVTAPNGGERILAILGPGSMVGELSMIDGAPRSASVTALRDSKLHYVSKADFEAIGKSSPEIYQHVMKVLARRLRDTNSALAASRWLMPRLGIHLGAGIVALIVNAFIGAVVLLLILRVGGGWGRRRDGVGAGSRLKSSSSAISAHVLSPLLN